MMPIDRVLPELLSANPLGLLNLGLLLLLITPASTLVTVLITYSIARNWRFAGIALLVDAILALSLAISLKWIRLF